MRKEQCCIIPKMAQDSEVRPIAKSLSLSTSTYSHSTQAPRLGVPESTQPNPHPTEEGTGPKACQGDLLRGFTGLVLALGSVQGSVI